MTFILKGDLAWSRPKENGVAISVEADDVVIDGKMEL